MEIGHSANAPAVSVSKPCKAFASQALFHGELRSQDVSARPINHSASFRHACRQHWSETEHLRLHSPGYCSIEQFFRVFDSLPQGFGLFLERHSAHRRVLQIADAVVAERGKGSIIKRTSAADMPDKLGCKILKRECDHARLRSAAVRILEDLFIIHRVSSPVCARGGRRAVAACSERIGFSLAILPSFARRSKCLERLTTDLHLDGIASGDRGGSGQRRSVARQAGGSSRSVRRKMSPGACAATLRSSTTGGAGHQPPYACTGDSRGWNC